VLDAMLEQLARPPGLIIGPRPLQLEDAFERLTHGWRPRSPAFGDELAALEASHCRGDCVSPLLQDGDTAFVDRRLRAQPGDLATFRLSARGCDAQNRDLPVGQSPWAPGASWAKLMIEYRGLEMLLDRHGGAATATLLACESADDRPILHPVRNVMRGGRLLYAPDTFAAQLGNNAATVTYATGSTASGTGNTGFTGYLNTGVVLTPTSQPNYDCTVIVTVTIQARQTVGTLGQMKVLPAFADNGSTYVYSGHEEPVLSASYQLYTCQWEFSHSSANTGSGRVAIFMDNTGASTNSMDFTSASLQAEYIVR
jgi:hypothetical protein